MLSVCCVRMCQACRQADIIGCAMRLHHLVTEGLNSNEVFQAAEKSESCGRDFLPVACICVIPLKPVDSHKRLHNRLNERGAKKKKKKIYQRITVSFLTCGSYSCLF